MFHYILCSFNALTVPRTASLDKVHMITRCPITAYNGHCSRSEGKPSEAAAPVHRGYNAISGMKRTSVAMSVLAARGGSTASAAVQSAGAGYRKR